MTLERSRIVLVRPAVAVILALLSGAVRADSDAIKVTNPDTGRVQWMDSSKLQSGPVQHERLTERQEARARALHQLFADVDPSTLEKWIDDFRHDFDVDRELAVWDEIARAYKAYCDKRALTREVRGEVYRILLMRSGAPEDEVLLHFRLALLSRDQAREVMRGYREPPHPVKVKMAK